MGRPRRDKHTRIYEKMGLDKRVLVSVHERAHKGLSPLDINPLQAAENTKKALFRLNGAGITKKQRYFGEHILDIWADKRTPVSAASWMLFNEASQSWYVGLTPGSIVLAYAAIEDCIIASMPVHPLGDQYSTDRQNAVRVTGQQLAIACGGVANFVALDQHRISNPI